MYLRSSFVNRLGLLLALMVISAAVDLARNKRQSVKYKEYAVVLLAGLLGAVFGFANDLVTSALSSDYFILGKGLEEGARLRWEAALYGLQVGCSAGVIGGAVLLYAGRRQANTPPLAFDLLVRTLWLPMAAAILVGCALPFAISHWDPAHFGIQLESILPPDRIRRFRTVWWTHVGLYAGFAAGIIATILWINRQRKKLSLTQMIAGESSRPGSLKP